MFDWGYATEVFPQLIVAMRVTIAAALGGMGIALVLGLVWAVLRRLPWRPAALAATWFVEFVRSTPLLVQLYFFFYLLPDYGLRMSAFVTGVLALGLHYSAYTAEVYRAGIDGVPRGQWEAARALNLSPATTFFRVVLPQAIPPILPALGNYLIAMFKETPLLSAITVIEVLGTAKNLGSENFRYLEPVTIVGGLFLAVSLVASQGVRRLERRINPETARP